MQTAVEQGTRALEQLRNNVQVAIEHLGAGFLAHPHNHDLRNKLQDGRLDPQEYYRQLLRLVYRLLFLSVAEDRELLLDPDADDDAKARYTHYYSTRRQRDLASLADYADLDGNLLVTNDPYRGITMYEGRITLTELAGLGVVPAPL